MTRRSTRRDRVAGRRWRPVLPLCAAVLTAVGCQGDADSAIESGDRLLAVGQVDGAIAEYKLARRQGGDEPRTLLRLGHAYATQGDVDGARTYLDPLLAADPDQRAQVAAELVSLAYEARERGVSENMARALAPVVEWGPGYVPADLRLALARHRFEDGDYDGALALLLSVMDDGGQVDPDLRFLMARAYEELGGCERSVPLYQRYLSDASRTAEDYETARWHYGNCLFLVADEDRASGRPSRALERLNEMVQVGVPRAFLDDAHFLRGELLLGMGQTETALAAYRRVLDLNPARSGSLVRRAEDRIRQIRFGF